MGSVLKTSIYYPHPLSFSLLSMPIIDLSDDVASSISEKVYSSNAMSYNYQLYIIVYGYSLLILCLICVHFGEIPKGPSNVGPRKGFKWTLLAYQTPISLI